MTKHAELYACLYAREFPAQALLRLKPDLTGKPCVVMAGDPPLQQVCSLNKNAHTLGVAYGMTQVEVDTFPSAIVLERSLNTEELTRTILLECAGGFSPRVEDCSIDGTFLCVIDIAGTRSLFGPPEPLAQNLLTRVKTLGVSACIAVSSNFHAAIAIAKGLSAKRAIKVVPNGEECAALAGLPLHVLDLTEKQAETFSLWGIHTLGMLAALPEKELISRMGQAGKRLRQLACGELSHLFQPVEPVFTLEEQMELDSPVELLDALLFVVNVMLEQLIFRATARILALASVTIVLKLEAGRTHSRTVRPAKPTNDKQSWIKLLHLDLEAHPPSAAILALTLTAESGRTSKVQLGLFSPQLPEPSRLDVTLARIRAIVGDENVGQAVLDDTHAAEGFHLEPFTVPTTTPVETAKTGLSSALRQLRPAEPVAVTLQTGSPKSFTFRERRYLVERAYGPWLTAGEWWNPSLWDCEHWDLIARSHDGLMLSCCLVHDLMQEQWQMVALYDWQYVELHANSAFSFLQAASSPENLVERAIELNMPAMALLDHNGIYGSARFHTSAKLNGLKAHVGAEVAVSSFGLRLKPPPWLPNQFPDEPARLPLLCESREGYQNLCQLITQFKMRESTKNDGAATTDDLKQYSSGLVCLTGGDEGPLAAALARGGEEAGRATVENLTRIFGYNNVYVKLQRHQERAEEWRNQTAIRIARSLNLPIIATNGVKYAARYDREIQDLFTAIHHHVPLDQAGRLLAVNSERYLRTASKMVAPFHDFPEAVERTADLSSRLKFELDDLGYQFPHYPVPDGETMDSFLRKRVADGIQHRYGQKNRSLFERAKKQVEHELALIKKLGFAGYFLIVWDIVAYCKRNGILVQGRGSAANSAVCYALEITAVDPIGMDLLFERFLSESRGEWPDIDLDLPSGDKREQTIQYVYQRYGELGAPMTANVSTYRQKSAAREVGKALGFDEESLGRLSKLAGQWEWRGKTDAMAHSFMNAGFDIQHPRVAKYLELSMRIQDLPRNLSQHSGGMVICQGQLNRVVPLERARMDGRSVVQWDKEDCACLGLIKVDLLGLGMMAVLHDCLELMPRYYGETVDLANLPQDEEVYRVLQEADTVGMFQVESRAQMASLPLNHPKNFYDLVVQVAIIRPGPIVGEMMHPYMRRRQGREEITYPHLLLEPVLKRTLGVPLFQEQLLRMAMIIADFTGAEAEELRRAVGMRRSWERMKNLEGKFRAGMTAKDIDVATQDRIIQQISSFALYGFPESHAASFALIAYASAYFKVKYPAAFMCAILNNQPMGFYSPAVLVKDAQRHRLRIKPIDIQASDWSCAIEREQDGTLSVRLGLSYVKGLRKTSGEALVKSRAEEGHFRSAEDLARRFTPLTEEELRTLARIGALNRIDGIEHRRDALWQVERAGKPEGPLFGRRSEWLHEKFESHPLIQMTTEERLVADYAGTGITTGKHPMYYRRAELREQGVLSAEELRTCRDGEFVRMAGCVITRQRPGTAKGVIFMTLEDETNISNVIVMPDIYDQNRLLVTRSKFLLVEGILQNRDNVVHVRSTRLMELADHALAMQSHYFH